MVVYQKVQGKLPEKTRLSIHFKETEKETERKQKKTKEYKRNTSVQ